MSRSAWAAITAVALPLAASAGAEPDENGITAPSIASSLPHNGDPGGMRKWLASHGIAYSLIYTNDTLSNLQGGARRGTVNQGKVEAIVTADLEKLAGLKGLSFFANAFQIHNTGRIRRDYVGGINTIAAIEAVPSTRLSELWLEQKLADGKASLRFGQLAADVEFFFSGISAMFLQSDWATITAANLPSGGPAYPLSTPGVRLKIDPTEDTSLLVAVFNGDPAGPGAGDEQIRNRHGTNFRVRDPALLMGEAQHRANQGKSDTGLARTIKLGGWTHLGEFDDRRQASDGRLLADPASNGEPVRHRGHYGLYGVFEQQIYRPKGGDAESGVTLFGRLSFSPDRYALIDVFADGGIVFAGMLPSRPDDRFGLSVMYARFSGGARDSDRDQIAFSGMPGVVRDFEANLEFTYVAQIVPGWTVQPVLTHVWHPNGDASRNAWVTGVRSIWRY